MTRSRISSSFAESERDVIMRKRAGWIVMAALMACCSGCWRQDIRTVGFSVPAMKSAECSKIIQDSLMAFEGIITAQPDFEQGLMVVTYDSKKLANVNVEHQIAALGFEVNSVPASADARARLPAGCR